MPTVLRNSSWLWAQGSFLLGVRELFGAMGIEPRLSMCKTIAPHTCCTYYSNSTYLHVFVRAFTCVHAYTVSLYSINLYVHVIVSVYYIISNNCIHVVYVNIHVCSICVYVWSLWMPRFVCMDNLRMMVCTHMCMCVHRCTLWRHTQFSRSPSEASGSGGQRATYLILAHALPTTLPGLLKEQSEEIESAPWTKLHHPGAIYTQQKALGGTKKTSIHPIHQPSHDRAKKQHSC